jgi:hypothetical protein
MNKINHSFDLSLDQNSNTENLARASYFAEAAVEEKAGFDCAGTVGTFGSAGGCAGTFGSFGCCC